MNNTIPSNRTYNIVNSTTQELATFDRVRELSIVRKQIRFIRDLYANHPTAVVAGGALLNHFHKAGAKDIDIFVGSFEEARQILAMYPNNVEDITYAPTTEVQQYQHNDIVAVYEGPVLFRHNIIPVNIIVRRDLTQPNRLSRGFRTVTSFPYVANMMFYSEVYGDLHAIRRQSSQPMARLGGIITPEYTERLLTKGIFLARNSGNRILWGLGNWLHTGLITAPASQLLPMNARYFKVTTRDTIGLDGQVFYIPQGAFANPTEAGIIMGGCTSEDEARAAYNARGEAIAQRQAEVARQLAELSTVRQSLVTNFSTRTGSLSRDWSDSGVTVQAVQPSGGTDSEMALNRVEASYRAFVDGLSTFTGARLRS